MSNEHVEQNSKQPVFRPAILPFSDHPFCIHTRQPFQFNRFWLKKSVLTGKLTNQKKVLNPAKTGIIVFLNKKQTLKKKFSRG
jgi:hypothetical protein